MVEKQLKQIVKLKYREAARRAASGSKACCGPSASPCCGPSRDSLDPVTSNLYERGELESIPGEAAAASLGCGNPTALGELQPGETVLDLGSGGGIDVFLAAERVGPEGRVYGLDMTAEMLELARASQRKAGVTNAEFLEGEMEAIPLPDSSVDVIISNCVINLSDDKDRVLAEAHRVLKPGGRLAVSDIVVRGEVPESVRRSVELWIGCVAGALEESEFLARLRQAGFEDVSIEPTRIYTLEDARLMLGSARAELEGELIDLEELAPRIEGRFMSAFIRARKPA